MGRTYVVFGDIEGKLDVLRVVPTMPAEGRYSVRKLIEKYGRKGRRELLSSDYQPGASTAPG